MKGTIKIGNKEVGMVANAASPFIYRQIFKKDFLAETQKDPIDLALFAEMGFIMHLQNEKPTQEVLKTSLDDFYVWLEEFDPMDIMNASVTIGQFYMGQEATLSVPKTEGG